MRVTSLASGSTGNALLVEAGPQGRTKLLVDAGLNGRLLVNRLRQLAVPPALLQGVLVTHEHSDHIIGLPTLMKRFAIPAIADPRTLGAIEESFASGVWRTDAGTTTSRGIESDSITKQPREGAGTTHGMWQGDKLRYITSFSVGSRCIVGDIEVRSFPVSH